MRLSPASKINSTLMCGTVQHTRYSPRYHRLNYSLFMPAIDLDELEILQQSVWGFGTKWWHWARFRREDYLGTGDLKQCVQQKVAELSGVRLSGRVVMLCQLRYLGIYFSPVNFYYLFDEENRWRYLLAEVSNTPWNERHYYAVNAQRGAEGVNWCHPKAFHVSPFNPMQQEYRWRLRPPGKRLWLSLAVLHASGEPATESRGNKVFDATLALKAVSFTSRTLIRRILLTPIAGLKLLWGIYWHALKLWLKKVPYYPHPAKSVAGPYDKNPIHPNESVKE